MERRHRRWLKGKARVQGLGRRLRQARLERELTLEAVGERLAVASNTVWRWEAGVHEPVWETLEAVAVLYGRPVAWFLEEGQPLQETVVSDPDLGALLGAWENLTVEGQDFVRAVVRTALQHARQRDRS